MRIRAGVRLLASFGLAVFAGCSTAPKTQEARQRPLDWAAILVSKGSGYVDRISQVGLPSCTAFPLRVAGVSTEDLIVTAGHCVDGLNPGASVSFESGLSACLVARSTSPDVALMKNSRANSVALALSSTEASSSTAVLSVVVRNAHFNTVAGVVSTASDPYIDVTPDHPVATNQTCPGDSGGPVLPSGVGEVVGLVDADCGGSGACGGCSLAVHLSSKASTKWISDNWVGQSVCP